MVGADYFADNPTVPAADIVADVNLDMPVLLYRFEDMTVFGAERSTLGPIVRRAVASAGVDLTPNANPEVAFFVRSDHYRFVEQGVPSVFLLAWGGAAPGGSQVRRIPAHLLPQALRRSDAADPLGPGGALRRRQLPHRARDRGCRRVAGVEQGRLVRAALQGADGTVMAPARSLRAGFEPVENPPVEESSGVAPLLHTPSRQARRLLEANGKVMEGGYGMIVQTMAAAAATNAGFDVEAATRGDLDLLQGPARAKSDAYFEGGYWLVLWMPVVAVLGYGLLLATGLSARLSGWGRRATRRLALAATGAVRAALHARLDIAVPALDDLRRLCVREAQYGLMSQSFGAGGSIRRRRWRSGWSSISCSSSSSSPSSAASAGRGGRSGRG
ncbi:M28 family peptidase [Sphingomonas sp. MMS24-JH45]